MNRKNIKFKKELSRWLDEKQKERKLWGQLRSTTCTSILKDFKNAY